jgi:TfoX/Sxy family transcriptional regulator of competence genes
MSTSQSTIDFLLDQLSGLPSVRAQKMFGEYALYCDEKVVALVCDNQLFVKLTPQGKVWVGQRFVEGEAYPGAKPSMVMGAEEIDDGERLCELIRITADALPAPKKAAKATKSRGGKGRKP